VKLGRRELGGEEGLTLAELATTLGFSAVVLLAMAPVLSRLAAAYQLRGAAQQMFGELQRARLAAVSENNRYAVRCEPGSDRYRVHDDDNDDDVENDASGSLWARALSDSPGVVFESADPISFAPNGTALGSGEIVLVNGAGEKRVVTVGAGGRVRIR
jgi:Tfp pilus assembly protein FimT